METWCLITPDKEGKIQLAFDILIKEFERIFGYETMHKEYCEINNEPDSPFPQLIINRPVLQIRLSLSSPVFFPQAIYQLSHELGHYAFLKEKVDKRVYTSWFEEIVCEAVSLYALKFVSELSPEKNNPASRYLNNILSQKGTNEFEYRIKTDNLKLYNAEAEKNRDSRINERNALYEIILDKPEDLKVLCNYQMHTSDNIHIDFSGWYDEHPCAILEFFENLMFHKDDNFNVSD